MRRSGLLRPPPVSGVSTTVMTMTLDRSLELERIWANVGASMEVFRPSTDQRSAPGLTPSWPT